MAVCESAYPSATPMNGAVHGVATMTASTPVKKLPVYPCFAASDPPALVKVSPISNCPASERPRKKSSAAISERKTGDWN